LNCDDQKTLRKSGNDITTHRPDITHQVWTVVYHLII
jgi:hypothetical protein